MRAGLLAARGLGDQATVSLCQTIRRTGLTVHAAPHKLHQMSLNIPLVANHGPVASAAPAAAASSSQPRRISLALQGGGSLGAFTWGVLDRLLEEDNLEIDTVSGASAGAVNAVVMASGLREGGREGARENLRTFWTRLVDQAPHSIVAGILGGFGGASRARMAFDVQSRVLSPYQTNPLGLNPLRGLLAQSVDADALRADPPFKLLIAATRVADGSLRMFRESEITIEAVLASTCLPLLHHAVEIDGETYWDGGYASNPPLIQLVETSDASSILLVQIIPTEGNEHPTTSPHIVKRLNQITFNTPLMHEIESIASMRRLAEAEGGDSPLARKLSDLQLDRLAAEEWYAHLGRHSALDLDRDFVMTLHTHGRRAAEAWLAGEPPSRMP
jgi:NTE family protein